MTNRNYSPIGTAAAVHAGHRISFDHDHVVKDLAKNYDAAILGLESIAGCHTNRRVKGKMVLGKVNKIAAGLRNQRRSAPLETTEVFFQELYAEFKNEAGDLLTAVAVKLSLPDPYDLTDIDLSEYKGIVARWNNWRAVQAQCTSLATALMTLPL
jgi:hypothetical protein